MYVAMNRFKVHKDRGDDFVKTWRKRDSFYGFESFCRLQGELSEESMIFIGRSLWKIRESFNNWIEIKSHQKGSLTFRCVLLCSPSFESFK